MSAPVVIAEPGLPDIPEDQAPAVEAAAAEPIVIDRPGLYDLADHIYHGDPVPGGSLSSSMAKKLILPSCPALALEEHLNREHKPGFDYGHGSHKKVLGKGADIAVIPFPDWRKKEAQELRDAAYAAGQIPLLSKHMAAVEKLAKTVLSHPVSGALFEPGRGLAERSIFRVDERTGAVCRSMLDWLILDGPNGRPMIVDLKTIEKPPTPRAIAKAVDDFCYHQQDPFYRDAVESLGYEDVEFLFVFVQKGAPHLIQTAQLDAEALDVGRARNAEAIDVWNECQDSGIWPGFPESDDIELISLLRYATNSEGYRYQ